MDEFMQEINMVYIHMYSYIIYIHDIADLAQKISQNQQIQPILLMVVRRGHTRQ